MNDVSFCDDVLVWILSYLDGWQVYPEPDVVTSETVDDSDSTEESSESTETTEENSETDETSETTTTETTDISPFINTTELNDKANKTITRQECRLAYEETLDQAYIHTNRLNIDDLTEVEARMFIRGVCKWTASNLWNKYNIRVNNEDMEDTYVQSYGGLLYKSALKMLNQFINQRIMNLSSYTEDNIDDDDVWII